MNIQVPQELDLTACDREPIHIPGSIQPHGILIAVDLADMAITYASANTALMLGLDSTTFLKRPFREALPELAVIFEGEVTEPSPIGSARYIKTVQVNDGMLFDSAISAPGTMPSSNWRRCRSTRPPASTRFIRSCAAWWSSCSRCHR